MIVGLPKPLAALLAFAGITMAGMYFSTPLVPSMIVAAIAVLGLLYVSRPLDD